MKQGVELYTAENRPKRLCYYTLGDVSSCHVAEQRFGEPGCIHLQQQRWKQSSLFITLT